MAGRPRKPTPLHLIEGHEMKAAQRAAAGEPPPEPVVLTCPLNLDKGQRIAWEYLAGLAGGMRVTSKEDVAIMQVLACSWAAREELEEFFRALRAAGVDTNVYETTTKDGSTMIRPRPQVAMLRELERQVTVLLGRFGLTPSDRSKVKASVEAGPNGSGDPDEEFT